jgi:SAM-dependent methyltransferase
VSGYDVERYWSGVAGEIGSRPGVDVVAGDDDPLARHRRARFAAEFLDALSVEGRSVLEVGCGPGGNLARLARREPRRLVGCDISAAMLSLAERTTAGSGVELVGVDGASLPFDDGEFDLTFTVTVLQHNHDDALPALVASLCRVTSKELVLFEDTARRPRQGPTWALRPVSRYAAVCASIGFELVESSPLGVGATEWLRLAVERVSGRGARPEGRPAPRRERALQRVGLPIARRADRLLPQSRGLTRMTFRPVAPAAAAL